MISGILHQHYNSQWSGRKGDDEASSAYRIVARGMEEQLIRLMVNQMRKTIVPETPPSSALAFYQSMLDGHYASAMAKNRMGMGLQQIIFEQIYPGSPGNFGNSGDKKNTVSNQHLRHKLFNQYTTNKDSIAKLKGVLK